MFTSDFIDRSTDEAVYTIAHELAHVYLEHSRSIGSPTIDGFKQREKETDQQVIKWGFEKELRNSPDNYLYGEGNI